MAGQRILRRGRGFTLLEVLAVVVIISVLALVAIPAFLGARAASEDSACDANRKAILTAITNYHARRGALDTQTATDLTADDPLGSAILKGKFLASIPKDPTSPESDTAYKVTITRIEADASTFQGDGFQVLVECGKTTNNHGNDTAYL